MSRLAVLFAALCLTLPASAQAAVAPQPPLDITKMDYAPLGHFKPPATLPANAGTACQEAAQPLRKGEIFNPSGKWNAFDNNVFEVLCYPFRGPGDTTDNDPVGNKGAAQHGRCGGTSGPDDYGTWVHVAGVCDNHQLEWSRYYAETMKEILKDFGVTVRQHTFELPAPGAGDNTRGGRAINTSVVVPGADNPDEHIIVGAHYDKTLDGPAAAWDSQEGHAEMIRMAKIMADYWKATGTRPSATIKFIPWDGEESGVFGSEDYAKNNIVPGEEYKVRGYWNTDPCAGGYPSYRYGNPADRLRMGIQLADPGAIPGVSAGDATRITNFNRRAETLLQQVLDRIDDSVDAADGNHEVFISNAEGGGSGDVGARGGIAIGSDRPVLFSSDWASFEVLGIPFFNPGPEVTGPNQESSGEPNYGPDQSADALSTFHTPNDNLQTMFRFTQADPTGLRYSASWAKGMEFCSHLLAWGMLQPDQGGAQRVNNDPVAYYEALPNEAKEDQKVRFDATGSHQVGGANLEFSWDFGDGNTGTGAIVDHEYNAVGRFDSRLTVRNPATGQTDSMGVPITVLPNDVQPPTLTPPPGTDEDGTFDLKFDYAGDRKNLKGFSIEESTNGAVPLNEPATDMNRWEASKDVPPTVAPWQPSDSPTPKYHGNLNTSKPRSFWTGVPNGQNTYQQSPEEGTSILTLKDTFQVPRGTNAALSYNSNFVSDTGDKARVQVAIDTGVRDQVEWVTVDTFATGAGDAESLSIFEEQQGDDSGATMGFTRRFADLTKFAGRRLKMRFIYELGPHDPTFPFARPGWYVDDIKVVAGSYREIGQTTAKTFTVASRRRGTYSYRVKAVFDDNIKSSASNAEAVTVTRGDPDGPGPLGAGSSACGYAAAAGFSRLAVRPTGRNLRFDLGTTAEPATIDLIRVGTSRRAHKPRRIARLKSVTGPVTLRRRRLASGFYYARITARSPSGARDVRTYSLRRVNGRFRKGKAFTRLASCGLLSSYSLNAPVFSGRRPLTARVTTTQPARLIVRVFRGKKAKKPVARFVRNVKAGRAMRLRLRGRRIRRSGEYRIVASVSRPGESAKATLIARRLR